jgi:putative aldouronate transport system substrate-binding protein
MYPRTPTHGDFDNMWFFKEIAKRTNINIKVQAIESAGWEEKKALAFATGDLPDIFLSGLTAKDENMYGPQGLLVDLKPLIDKYGQESKALFDKYPEVRKTFSTEQGSIYTIPTFSDYKRDTALLRAYINKTWLGNLGLKMPSNLDELYTVLKAFKDQDPNKNGKPDEIPMSGTFAGNTKIIVLTALGFVNQRHDLNKDKYVYVPIQPAYKDYLTFMNKIYKEGLLDKEFFSQKPEQVLAKEKNLAIGVTADSGGYSNIGNANLEQFVLIPPLLSSANQVKTSPKQPAYQRWGTFAITNKSKHPEALMRLVDYLFTLEGSLAMRAGPELGVVSDKAGYEYVTVNGVKTFKTHFEGYPSFYDFRQKQSPVNGPFYNGQTIGDYLTYNDPQQVWLTNIIMNSGIVDVARYAYPEVKFTPQEQEKIASYIDMDSYADQMEAKFIMGETPLSEWDNYLATFKKLGVDDMIKIRQAAYDRWNSVK